MSDVKLPVDATGKEIPLDTRHMYDNKGERFVVGTMCYYPWQDNESLKWDVMSTGGKSYDTDDVYLDPPDSLEKLLEDLDKATEDGRKALCTYKEQCMDDISCIDCAICAERVLRDIADRIRKLRGESE